MRIPQNEAPLPTQAVTGGVGQGGDGLRALPQRLERYGVAHKRALLMADYANAQEHSQVAHRLRKCGEFLLFRHYFTIDTVRLHAADFCRKHLICPLCAIRRGAKYLKAYMDRFAAVTADKPGLHAYLVTLTVKDGHDLRERFEHLRSAMKRMTQARRRYLHNTKWPHVEFAKAVGGVHSIEVKRGAGSGLWHPHSHAVWLCYEAPDAQKLAMEWQEWTGDSFVVDVRPFYDQGALVNGFAEVFKYALKFSDMELADNWHAADVLKERRLIDSFGLLRGVEVPESLLDEPVLDELPYVEFLYRFLRSGYVLAGGGA